MNKATCCLWQGHDLPAYSQCKYTPQYVANLAHGLGHDIELVCYSQHLPSEYQDVAEWRPFKHEHKGGWSRRLEVFAPENRPGPGERHVMFDLDTIIVGDCRWLWEWSTNPIGCPRDPYFLNEVCSTVISYDEQGAEALWDAYQAGEMHDLRYARGRYSEMALIRHLYRSQPGLVGTLETEPLKLLSYKVHVKGEIPWHEASLVYFHGNPKPHDLPEKHALKRIWSANQHQA